MSNYEYDFLVYIGRFQPLHLGHQHVIDEALRRSKRVIVLCGSANMPRTPDNPFTFPERHDIILLNYQNECKEGRLIVKPLDDISYDDDRWLGQLRELLTETILEEGNNHASVHLDGLKDFKIGVIGHNKDASSYYLEMVEVNLNADFIEVEQWGTLSATDIRNNFFQKAPILPDHLCSDRTVTWLAQFMLTPAFKYIVDEKIGLYTDYIQPWEGSPYTPHFCTADAVVTQTGHILLVRRSKAPGKGLLALPGGHVKPSIGGAFDNCIAELWEEARPSDGHSGRGKAMPKGRLRGFYTGVSRLFDKPGRDPRGFYSTMAYRFVFPDGKLWDVKGGIPLEDEANDVDHAGWYPINELDSRDMFADHYFIIQQMLSQKGDR